MTDLVFEMVTGNILLLITAVDYLVCFV